MSEDEYYAAMRAIGLKQGQFAETWFDVNGNPHSVPLARDLTPEARAAVVAAKKKMMADTA